MDLKEFSIKPIGHVRSPILEPIDEGWASVESSIVIEADLRDGLRGLAEFSHLIVVTFLHRALFDPKCHLVRRPRGLAEMPEVGIFAQRAKDRPNPIGLTCVPIVAVEKEAIRVRGLDAIDGTPVLDIKPYFEPFDFPGPARVPDWVHRVMQGYF